MEPALADLPQIFSSVRLILVATKVYWLIHAAWVALLIQRALTGLSGAPLLERQQYSF